MPDPVAKPTPSGEEQIATVRRLVSQMEGRKLYLEAEHQAASIHVYKADLDGMRAVLARLEADAFAGQRALSAALPVIEAARYEVDPENWRETGVGEDGHPTWQFVGDTSRLGEALAKYDRAATVPTAGTELQDDLSEAFDEAFLPAWREVIAKHGTHNVIPAWASWGPQFLRAAAVAREHRISTAIAPAALLVIEAARKTTMEYSYGNPSVWRAIVVLGEALAEYDRAAAKITGRQE